MLFAAVAGLAAQALWAGGRSVAFDIPAGDFSQSVIQFYKQSNVEILYASVGSIGEVRTQADPDQPEPDLVLDVAELIWEPIAD